MLITELIDALQDLPQDSVISFPDSLVVTFTRSGMHHTVTLTPAEDEE